MLEAVEAVEAVHAHAVPYKYNSRAPYNNIKARWLCGLTATSYRLRIRTAPLVTRHENGEVQDINEVC